MSSITTHVLDTARGLPAAGVPVVLERVHAGEPTEELGRGATDADGRLRTLLDERALEAGTYRLRFDTSTYFESLAIEGFYPEVSVLFEVRDPARHHHVPLLLSPYGYSTYRGS